LDYVIDESFDDGYKDEVFASAARARRQSGNQAIIGRSDRFALI
jgi:hypothetical protein